MIGDGYEVVTPIWRAATHSEAAGRVLSSPLRTCSLPIFAACPRLLVDATGRETGRGYEVATSIWLVSARSEGFGPFGRVWSSPLCTRSLPIFAACPRFLVDAPGRENGRGFEVVTSIWPGTKWLRQLTGSSAQRGRWPFLPRLIVAFVYPLLPISAARLRFLAGALGARRCTSS